MIPTFTEFLEVRLAAELPGWQAQLRMAPRVPRLQEPSPQAPRTRDSAVLVLLVPAEEDYELLLTVRSSSLTHHGGQISFPGGRVEPGEDIPSAAMREAWEEVGLDVKALRHIGMLSPLYVSVSNSMVHPVIGVVPEKPKLVLNPDEVEEIVFAPLSNFASDQYFQLGRWTLGGRDVEVPYWEIHRVPLWGATAMIISELLTVYGEYRSQFG